MTGVFVRGESNASLTFLSHDEHIHMNNPNPIIPADYTISRITLIAAIPPSYFDEQMAAAQLTENQDTLSP